MFLVDRYFLGIKPADCTSLPKKHQHTYLKSKSLHGSGRSLNLQITSLLLYKLSYRTHAYLKILACYISN